MFAMTSRSKLALTVLALITTGLAQAQMPVDAYDPNVNGTVNTISRGFTGELLIGGGFSQVGGQSRPRLALLRADGHPDPFFQPSLGSGAVFDSLRDTFGDFVVVGSFTSGGNRIARIDPETGAAVGSMSAVNPNGTIRAVAEAAEADPITLKRKLYLGGEFSTIGGQARTRVARVNYNGSLDTSFVPPAYAGIVYALAVQDDGKLMVGGSIGPEGEFGGRRIYRLNSDGSQDAGFTAPAVLETGNHSVRAIALDLGGRIVIAGANSSGGFVMRLNPNGSLDPTFTAPNLNGPVLSLALQPDGRLVIGGDFSNASLRARLARLNDDGSVDSSFVPLMNPNGAVNALEVRPGGEVVFAGEFTNINNTIPRNRIAAVNRHGRLDTALSVVPSGGSNPRIRAIVPDGNSMLVGGHFSSVNGSARPALARVLLDGTVSNSFQPVISGGGVESITVQKDGRILIAGTFVNVNGLARSGVARLFPDGSLDTSFVDPALRRGNNITGEAYFLRRAENGQLLIGGRFDQAHGQPRNGLVRLNANGSLDHGFVPSSALGTSDNDWSRYFRGAVEHPQGGYLISGHLHRPDSSPPEFNLVHIQNDGSLHPDFDTDFNPVFDYPSPSIAQAIVYPEGIFVVAYGVGYAAAGNPWGLWPSGPGTWRECRSAAWLTLSGEFDSCGSWARQDGRFRSIATRLSGGASFFGVTDETASNPLLVGLYNQPNDSQSLVTLAALGRSTLENNQIGIEKEMAVAVLDDGRVLIYSDHFDVVNGQVVDQHQPIRVRHDRFVDPEPVWDASSDQVTWQYGGGSIMRRTGAPLVYPPRVLVSNSCCNPDSFQPPAGGGQMVWSSNRQRWVLDGFQGLPGVFYLRIEAQAEDSRGNSWPIRTPIHRYQGTLPLPPAQADLEMKLLANVAEAAPGQLVEFSVQLSNRGPDVASDPEAFITLPAGYQLVDFSVDSGLFDPDQGYWKLDDLAASGPDASVELILQVQVLGQGGHVLRASADSGTFDPNYNNNQRSLAIDILLARSDLDLSIALDQNQVLPGDFAAFDIQVINHGPEPATGVVVNSAIPTGYTWQDDNGGGSFNPATGQWQVGNLAVGESATLKLTLQVNASGGYLMIGQTSSNSIDPDLNNNIAAAAIDPFTDLTVSLSAEPPQAALGDTVVIHVDFHNLGPADATAAQVQVQVPDSFLTTGHTSEIGLYEPANGIWDLGTLGPGTHRLSIVGAITIDNPQIATATVSSATFDLVPGNNSAMLEIQLVDGDQIFRDRFQLHPEPLIGQMQ